MVRGAGLEQLRRDAHPAAGASYAAFENVAHGEALADFAHIRRLPLVGEGRIARDDEKPGELGQVGDDVLADAVAEVLLLGVAAHVLERQHGDRGLVRRRGGEPDAAAPAAGVGRDDQAVDAHRAGDVFHRLLAEVLEGELDLVGHLVVRATRDEHAACVADALEPRRDVDPVAVQVVALHDHVAEVDPHAQHDALLRAPARRARRQRGLHFRRALHRVDHARELDQHAVAGGLENAAARLGDRRVDDLGAQALQARERAFLVCAHHAAEAHHVGGEDRRKAAQGRCFAHRARILRERSVSAPARTASTPAALASISSRSKVR